MENLEGQQIIDPAEEDLTNVEKIDKDFIKDIKALQSKELANIQKLSDEKKPRPVHLQEFVLVEPELLSSLDREAFRKFQDFMENKDKVNSKEQLNELMDYLKKYHLQYEKEARKVESVRNMVENKKSPDEIKAEINKIDAQEDAPENSKFFMDYLVNKTEGEYFSMIAK